MPSPSRSLLSVLGTVGQASHASPMPSPSWSAWPGFATVWQLLHSSARPSPSPSISTLTHEPPWHVSVVHALLSEHALPSGFGRSGGHASLTPSQLSGASHWP